MTSHRAPTAATGPKGLAPATRIGLCAIVLALAAAAFNPLLAALPLLLYLILCLAAPFFPAYGFFLPIVSRGLPETGGVAITFDDGPHPSSTPQLLTLLAKYNARATFYVNGCRVEQYPELVRAILNQGHTIGNHSHHHDNFIMFKRSAALKAEIEKTQRVLRRLGITAHTFRPPVGVTNPKLGRVLEELNMYAVNFSRRAGDMGNRQVAKLAARILTPLRPGDIIMLHDIKPHDDEKARRWTAEVERILSGIEAKNLKILPLATLIDRPVMDVTAQPSTGESKRR